MIRREVNISKLRLVSNFIRGAHKSARAYDVNQLLGSSKQGEDGGDPGDRAAARLRGAGGGRPAAGRCPAPGLLPGGRPRRAARAPGRHEGRRARPLRPPRRRQAPQRRRHLRQRLRRSERQEPALRGVRPLRRRVPRRRRRLLRFPPRATAHQGDRSEIRGEDARANRGRGGEAGREPRPGGGRVRPHVPGLAVPVPHQQLQLHAGHRGGGRRAGPHRLRLPHRAPGGRPRRRPPGGGPGHRRVRARGPCPRHLPRQPRRRRHGVEQRGAAQRGAPRAVRGGGAARLHRALPAGAQGRRGPRAGRLRRRRQPPPLQDFRLRRLPPPPADHRGACRGGPGTAGRVIHRLTFQL